ncbi:MAG TPA: efflux RND transporter permease subunit [Vicinamibacteria bacterium]|nr:efflux RND transporter permease subunit [Vicinamibacteria bacterium]
MSQDTHEKPHGRAPEPEGDPSTIATGMTFADISIRNHVFAWMLMLGLMGFGIIAFRGAGGVVKGLGVSQNPDVDYPVVNVSVGYEGASPEVMETDITDVVEDAMTSIEGVKEITSTSRQGSANVSIEFELSREIDAAVQDVQARVGQLGRRFPRDVDLPTVSKNNPEDQPIMWVGVSGDRTPTFLADYVRNVVKPAFQTIEGVGEIMFFYRERNVRVWFDATRLEAQGLTVQDVTGAIAREHIEMPAGRIEGVGREMTVRAEGEAIDIETFRNLVITYRQGAPIRLKDVAVVEDGFEDMRRVQRAMGQTALGFGIKKLRGANAVQVGHDVRARIETLRKQAPEGISININFDQTQYIEESINEILFTLVMAAILTATVCWLFLGSWTSTINILLAIPTSILGTFIAMYFLGFTLNTFTVLGLSLVVGIVVDDAIMVLENIYRHREMGEGKIKAASIGAREVTFAAAATTAAIVAIFMPVAFMKGIIGKFFFQFGVTISIAVLLSLLEALTLTPMRCSRFLQVGEKRGRLGRFVDRAFDTLAAKYLKVLQPALHHRGAVMIGSLVLFVASLSLLKVLPQEFVPRQDTGRLSIRFVLPIGTSMQLTDKISRQIETYLAGRPEIDRYFGGPGGGMGGGEVSSGNMQITMKSLKERPIDPKLGRRMTQVEFMDSVRRDLAGIPGARIILTENSQQSFTQGRGNPVEFSIRGGDWDTLAAKAQEIMDRLRVTGVVADVDSDYRLGMPEVQVIPDRNKAADLGISMTAIGETINAAIGGVRAGRFKDGGRRFDIRVRLLAQQREKPEDIARLLVRTRTGSLVRLGDLVRIEQAPSLQAITRIDRERAIRIFGNVGPGFSQAQAIDGALATAREILPDGYRALPAGSSQAFAESFDSLGFAFFMGIIVAYMVLAAQFNSFTHPVVVLMALPFSVSGALLMLYLMGQSLNVYSVLGLILLMGIAKKNSIMLVDFTNQIRARGVERHEALLQACPVRLRPILMTSIATIAGATPAAFALGPGAETQRPMAIGLMGGMIVSTVMTLFVVPAAYSVFDDVVNWNEERQKNGVGLFAGIMSPKSVRVAAASGQ